MENEQIEYRMAEGHEGYRVGSDGSVWSRWRRSAERMVGPDGKAWFRTVLSLGDKWRPLKAHNHGGYRRVWLRADAGKRSYLVHRLVCRAFHGEPPTPKHKAAHGDGKPTNNRADNLAWKTPPENQGDRVRHGTSNRGRRKGQTRLTEADVHEIRSAPRFRGSQTALAKRFGVGGGSIATILSGKRWWWLPWENEADKVVPRACGRLTDADVRRMKAEWRGRPRKETAKEFGVSRQLVSLIFSGKRWGWLDPGTPATDGVPAATR